MARGNAADQAEQMEEVEEAEEVEEELQIVGKNKKIKRFRTKANQMNRPYDCKFCQKRYGSSSSLKNHCE